MKKRIVAMLILCAAIAGSSFSLFAQAQQPKEATEETAEAPEAVEAAEPEEKPAAEPEPIPYIIKEVDVSEIEEFARPDLIPYIESVCDIYCVSPELVEAVIEAESRGIEDVDNALNCIGLMGISEYWNADRMERLNVTNLKDGQQNILTGVDLFAELFADKEDPYEVLNFYGGWEYSERGNEYIFAVLKRAADLERLHGK